MSKTYCTFPWVQATASANGKMILCCNSYQHYNILKESGEPFEVSDISNIDEYFNSPTLKNIRKQMILGQEPIECKKCYDIERQGGESIRNFSHSITPMEELFSSTNTVTGEITKNHFQHIHIIWGNKCNLMCKMCHPYSSDQLINEFKKLNLISTADVGKYQTFWNSTDNLESLKTIAPYLTYLNVSGGEPLVIDDFLNYCYYLIDSGYSKNIVLSFHTNLTVMPAKFFKLWHQFKYVNVKVSLDATSTDYEYIRYPGKWSVIDRNINNLIDLTKEHSSNITYDFHSVFSSFNAHAIPALIDYVSNKTSLFPYFNRVTDNQYSNCQVIPRTAKEKIYKDCLDVINKYHSHFNFDSSKNRISTLISHLGYMLEQDIDSEIFYNFVTAQDSLRKLSYKDVIPWANK